MIQSVERSPLDRLLDPVTRCLSVEAGRQLVNLRADPEVQERLDTLAGKSTEGSLTPEERSEYEAYVTAINLISILQAKARVLLLKPPSA